MKSIFPVLAQSPLFRGIEEKEATAMLKCLGPVTRSFAKGAFAIRFGQKIDSIGLVLSGSVRILQEDYNGNRNIIAEVLPGGTFAESYACLNDTASNVSVQTAETSSLMFLNARRVLTTCPTACAFHSRLIRNLAEMLAQKNLQMNEKLTCLTQRSTKDKLLSYLHAESRQLKSKTFDIPFNRQELADFLSVDRSALSNELGKLRDSGQLDFKKNRFRLFS